MKEAIKAHFGSDRLLSAYWLTGVKHPLAYLAAAVTAAGCVDNNKQSIYTAQNSDRRSNKSEFIIHEYTKHKNDRDYILNTV